MNLNDKIGQLLDNESFQDDILEIDIRSSEDKRRVQEKFNLSESELIYAHRLLTGISFNERQIPETTINNELKKLRNDIETNNSAPFQQRSVSFWLIRAAAVLSIPFLLSSVYFYRQLHQQKNQIIVHNPVIYNTFKAPMGAKSQIILPDGSLVWLNSGSSLSFPSRFDDDSRKVSLEGEAYFEVVKNENVPMVVSAGSMNVKVYGTKFNINAYEPGQNIETTLVEGKVTILPANDDKETELKPGFSAAFNPDGKNIQISQVNDMEAFTGWKDGKLLFRDERFIQILKKLERWYNVDIHISDESLYDYTLYATFIDENVEQVLDIFAHSIPISVEYPKRKVQSDGLYSKRTIIIKRDTNKTLQKN